MDKKRVVVFSQIDQAILERLQQQYEVQVLNPKSGDINEQIRQAVTNADGMIGSGRVLNKSNPRVHSSLRLFQL